MCLNFSALGTKAHIVILDLDRFLFFDINRRLLRFPHLAIPFPVQSLLSYFGQRSVISYLLLTS